MNDELCKKCVDSKNVNTPVNNVCEICKHIDSLGHGENKEFIEVQQRPLCCGQCSYKFQSTFSGDYYCMAARYFNLDDRVIANPYIRKNYLSKNTPKWCPFPKAN